MSKERVIARGNEAKALLENDTLSEAFEDILQNIMEQFLDSHNGEEATNLHMQAVAVKSVRGTLQRYLGTAKVELYNQKLDEENRLKNG